MNARFIAVLGLSLAFAGAFAVRGLAQAPVTVPAPMPPAKPAIGEDKMPAKQLFSAAKLPSLGKAMAIGYYPRGCLQGGVELPVDGPNWQVMRLSRNRNWGHPELVKFLEKFAPLAAKATGWNGILVGDMAQPRGGPLPFGHLSHQIGLDVDIWFMPMPDHELSKKEREDISAINRRGRGQVEHQSENLDAAARGLHQDRGRAARGRARAGQCRDQEGTVPHRGQAAFSLDGEGAALVRPRRPHPCAAEMPGRFAELPQAAAGAGRRRLRAPRSSTSGSRTRCCIPSRGRRRRSRPSR